MKEAPRINQVICHYETRITYRVVKCQRRKGDGMIFVTGLGSDGQTVQASLSAFDHYPQVGDVVLVALQPYQRWIGEQMQAIRGSGKYPPRAYEAWGAKLNDVDWLSTEFVFKRVENGLCLIQGDGVRREVPIECLRVLRKQEATNAKAG